MPSVYIENYGCSASQSEAEMMSGLLKQAGFSIAKDEKSSDLMIIVTCYVKSPTEQRILHRIRQLKDAYPDKKMIIAGCMPEGMYRTIYDTNPDASLVSTHHIKDIVIATRKTLEGKRVEYLGKSEEVKLCLPKNRENPLVDIVPISSGCNSACSYCCVRFSKGKLFSYPQEMIAKEIESSLEQGCKEFWMTSQDNASYGMDRGKTKLPELIDRISKIPGDFRVRIGMLNPKNVLTILPELARSYENEKIYKFIHLPLQSGDDTVLNNMNRGYDTNDFLKITEKFAKFNLWTDVIVGFPGEKDEQFESTIKIFEKIRPDYTNVSKFGKRPGVSLKGLEIVPPKTVNERSERVSELTRKLSLEKNKAWIGWEGDILVSKRGKQPGQWLGRNPAYKLVLVESEKDVLGRFLRVKIDKVAASHLSGYLAE